jgi:hypothetical protein
MPSVFKRSTTSTKRSSKHKAIAKQPKKSLTDDKIVSSTELNDSETDCHIGFEKEEQ